MCVSSNIINPSTSVSLTALAPCSSFKTRGLDAHLVQTLNDEIHISTVQ